LGSRIHAECRKRACSRFQAENRLPLDRLKRQRADDRFWNHSLALAATNQIARLESLAESFGATKSMMTRRAYPDIGHAVLMTLALLGIQVAGGMAIGIVALIVGGPGAPNAVGHHPATIIGINLVAFSAVLAWGFAANRVPWRTLLPLRPIGLAAVSAIILTIAGFSIVLSEVDNLVSMVLPKPEWFMAFFRDVMANERHPGMSLFLTVVAAATTEEVIFRGVILRGLLGHTRPAVAIGISALLFAFLHVNPWQFFGPLALGVLFGWWYVRTGSLVPGLIGHALGNGLATLSRHIPIDIPGFTAPHDPLSSPVHQPLWFTLAGAALLSLGVFCFHRATPSPPVPPLILPAAAPTIAN
jgi:membrane protease YdiL (CAAX protease family)